MIYPSAEHQVGTWYLAMITMNPPPPPPETVSCKHCGAPIPIVEGQKRREYCNAYCNKAHAYRVAISAGWKRDRSVPVVDPRERQCPICGTMFLPANRNYGRQKYCGRTCKRSADTADQRARRQAERMEGK